MLYEEAVQALPDRGLRDSIACRHVFTCERVAIKAVGGGGGGGGLKKERKKARLWRGGWGWGGRVE